MLQLYKILIGSLAVWLRCSGHQSAERRECLTTQIKTVANYNLLCLLLVKEVIKGVIGSAITLHKLSSSLLPNA